MKNVFYFTLFLTAFLTACKKDSADTRNSLLTSTDFWAVTKIEFFDSTTLVWEAFALDDCLTENCWSYYEDGTFEWDNGLTKCDPTEPHAATGTWTMSTDGKTLNLVLPGYGTESHQIIELTHKVLITQDSVSDFGPYTLVRDTYEPK